MKKSTTKNNTTTFEDELKHPHKSYYVLRLYVAGATPQSIKSVTHIKRICEEHLKDNHSLEIIDIYQQPQLVEKDQIVAVPTLIKESPLPFKRLIGDMSNTKRVLSGLGIQPIHNDE